MLWIETISSLEEVDAALAVPLAPIMTAGGGIGHMFAGPFLEANSPDSGNTFTFLLSVYNSLGR